MKTINTFVVVASPPPQPVRCLVSTSSHFSAGIIGGDDNRFGKFSFYIHVPKLSLIESEREKEKLSQLIRTP